MRQRPSRSLWRSGPRFQSRLAARLWHPSPSRLKKGSAFCSDPARQYAVRQRHGQASQSVTTLETVLVVDESYVKVDKLFGGLDTTLGRQYYGEAGDLVIYFGPKYNCTACPSPALDAGRFDWNGEKVGVTLVAGKTSKFGAITASNSRDVNLTAWTCTSSRWTTCPARRTCTTATTVNSGATLNGGVIATTTCMSPASRPR